MALPLRKNFILQQFRPQFPDSFGIFSICMIDLSDQLLNLPLKNILHLSLVCLQFEIFLFQPLDLPIESTLDLPLVGLHL